MQNTHQNMQNLQDKSQRDLGSMKKEIDTMKEKLRCEIGNLKEENHGFLRELQRNQDLFRQLHQEFNKILNEKKQVHQDFITNISGLQTTVTPSSGQKL